MPSLNACLQVASLAKALGIPYIEKLAKVVVVIMELLEQRGNTKKDVKALCKSIANTVIAINTVVKMHEEVRAAYFMSICAEMEEYLMSLVEDLKREVKSKHHGIKGLFSTKELRDAIQDYRTRVTDLKTDFLIHIGSESCLLLVDIQATQSDLKQLIAEIWNKQNTALEEEYAICTATKPMVLFFFSSRLKITAEKKA
ncbi:hypothetical protein EDD18DRAFT_1416029 [Armillaria luteobubalina]|uniref:Uncharacterized protein n=1 Tax=Armillaria luteobubalina TaxID=153913 RepID=A0AA39PX23_9AGAR|nr:hypothetical protein EDD18DRAFT_1416029 [Armillaria luteobubalina]